MRYTFSKKSGSNRRQQSTKLEENAGTREKWWSLAAEQLYIPHKSPPIGTFGLPMTLSASYKGNVRNSVEILTLPEVDQRTPHSGFGSRNRLSRRCGRECSPAVVQLSLPSTRRYGGECLATALIADTVEPRRRGVVRPRPFLNRH